MTFNRYINGLALGDNVLAQEETGVIDQEFDPTAAFLSNLQNYTPGQSAYDYLQKQQRTSARFDPAQERANTLKGLI